MEGEWGGQMFWSSGRGIEQMMGVVSRGADDGSS